MLKIYVTAGCRGCKRALELAEWVQKTQPGLKVRIVDLSVVPDGGSDLVFAVPTYIFDGKPIFLGNPSLRELQTWLDGLDPEVYAGGLSGRFNA